MPLTADFAALSELLDLVYLIAVQWRTFVLNVGALELAIHTRTLEAVVLMAVRLPRGSVFVGFAEVVAI